MWVVEVSCGAARVATARKKGTSTPKQPPEVTYAIVQSLHAGELGAALAGLSTGKSPRVDGVTNELLLHLPAAARETLLLFNKSWETGVVSAAWRKAEIVANPKKGNPWTLLSHTGPSTSSAVPANCSKDSSRTALSSGFSRAAYSPLTTRPASGKDTPPQTR